MNHHRASARLRAYLAALATGSLTLTGVAVATAPEAQATAQTQTCEVIHPSKSHRSNLDVEVYAKTNPDQYLRNSVIPRGVRRDWCQSSADGLPRKYWLPQGYNAAICDDDNSAGNCVGWRVNHTSTGTHTIPSDSDGTVTIHLLKE